VLVDQVIDILNVLVEVVRFVCVDMVAGPGDQLDRGQNRVLPQGDGDIAGRVVHPGAAAVHKPDGNVAADLVDAVDHGVLGEAKVLGNGSEASFTSVFKKFGEKSSLKFKFGR
jgi:hypothetical protein